MTGFYIRQVQLLCVVMINSLKRTEHFYTDISGRTSFVKLPNSLQVAFYDFVDSSRLIEQVELIFRVIH